MEKLFTFLAAIYFCCFVILFFANKKVKKEKQLDLCRFDFGWKWYLNLEDRWMIPLNLLISIFFFLLIFAMQEWI